VQASTKLKEAVNDGKLDCGSTTIIAHTRKSKQGQLQLGKASDASSSLRIRKRMHGVMDILMREMHGDYAWIVALFDHGIGTRIPTAELGGEDYAGQRDP
jgi:hypothetical protein